MVLIFPISLSFLNRFDDQYNLVLHFKDGNTEIERESNVTKSVGVWFDENGVLLLDLFQRDVCQLHDSLLAEKKEK